MEKTAPRIMVTNDDKLPFRDQAYASRVPTGDSALSRLPHSTRLLSVDEVMSLMSNAEKQTLRPYGLNLRQHRIASADGDMGTQVPMDEESDITSDGTLSRCTSTDRISLADGQVEERFRVDRRKLEAMILGCPPDPCDFEIMRLPIGSDGRILSADDFFARVMSTTDTDIRYPKLLKVGARNRKDPHIRVVGTPENVTIASHMVRQQLEPHNKITMKMDVSWTHHSHIIGKAGNTIQPVVRRTGVSIHFPDGNKNNEVRKSNQVSINSRGEELGGLEEARASIRLLTPLVFTFTLNANADFISITEPNVLVQHVQGLYNVQVELCVTVDRDPLIVGSVRGSETDVSRVKEATLTLLQMLCGSIANHLNVQMKIEVSPQHHSYVLGRSNETLKRIMQTTSTTIRFPDTSDPQLGPLQRSTVTISGAIDNVYAARQNIVGALPLVLMFEVANDSLNTDDMTQLMQSFNLVIIPKPARPDGRRPVIIKGAEKDAAHIYEAWKLVTQSDKKLPSVMIPPSYHIAQTPLPSLPPGARCGVWGATAQQPRTSNSSSVSGFPFSAPLPSPHSPTFLPTTPAFHPATPAFPNSSPSFTYPSTSPLFGAMMRGGPSPLWPSTQPTLLNTRFPFPTPRPGQHFSLPSSSEGSSNFFANVAALSSLSAANPASFFPPPEGSMFNSSSNAQYGYTPSSGDKLNNNYMGHNSNYASNPVLGPRALLSMASATADDHNADPNSLHQQYVSAPQRAQQQATLSRADESGSGGSCSSSCGVASPTVTSPNESSRDSSPDMVVLSHVTSPPGGLPKCAPPHPTNVCASPDVGVHPSPRAEEAPLANASAHYGPGDSARRSRDLSTLLSEFQDWRAPGCEKELQQAMQKLSISDYEAKQILANKAMREPVGGTVRVPTSNWSGYGFSKSSPSYQMRQQFQEAGLLKKTVDRTSTTSRGSPCTADDGSHASTKPAEGPMHSGWPTESSLLETSAPYMHVAAPPPTSGPYDLLMPASETQLSPQRKNTADDGRGPTLAPGAGGDEEEWGSGAKWSNNDGSSSSSAVTASAVDSGIAASITSSNQASLSLSDPESSDGLGHSGSSSASYGSSSALRGVGRGTVRGDLKHDERLSASTFHELISEERRQCAALAPRSAELDLPGLLESMSLSQYIDVFNSQEVDLRTFLTMNDSELKELGIGAFGHRKRLLIAIKNLTNFLPELSSARNGSGRQDEQQKRPPISEDRPQHYDASSKTVTWNC